MKLARTAVYLLLLAVLAACSTSPTLPADDPGAARPTATQHGSGG